MRSFSWCISSSWTSNRASSVNSLELGLQIINVNCTTTRAKLWTAVLRDQNGPFFYGSFLEEREGNTQFTWLEIKSNLAVCNCNYNHFITRVSFALTVFLNSLHNDTQSKAHLEVRLLSNEEYCKVEFRNENETLLSTLKWKLSSPCIDCQVSRLSDSLCPMRRNKYCIVIPLPRLGGQAPPPPYSRDLTPLKSTGNCYHNQSCFLKIVVDKYCRLFCSFSFRVQPFCIVLKYYVCVILIAIF